ncbi:MAG: EVE domain-containing protein [Planctomycetes bacterium]|nr:EVE domain-containing protein [Planctomycetota bacterium]
MPQQHWLIKTEPTSYSIDDLKRDKRTAWTGVRNYQARNFMRDGMKVGDTALFYHSSAEPTGVVGVARVCGAARPDPTALDPKDDHHDPKSTKQDPIWLAVDFEFVEKFAKVVALETLRTTPGLEGMQVLRRGQRLSIQPVTEEEFRIVTGLARGNTRGKVR